MTTLLNQLWQYNDWANKTVFKSFDQYGQQVPAPALNLLSHIINTQYIWLNRIQGEKPVTGVWDVHLLKTCKEWHEEASAGLKQKIEHASDLAEKIEYTNTKGVVFETSLQDILIHIFNHGTYHRAQIAQQMRRNGLEPVNTDYITYVR